MGDVSRHAQRHRARVDLKTEVTAIFRESRGPADFAAGLEAHGYKLCTGNRRGLCILDQAGEIHSLARRLDGVNTKQLNAFMEGFDRATLPTVEQAKERYQERKLAALETDRATVAQEIAREEALAKAAIEKAAPEEPQRGTSAYAKATADTLAGRQQSPAPEPVKPEGGTAAHIWEATHQSDSAPAFVAALAERGLQFARVHDDDRRPAQGSDGRARRTRPAEQHEG